MIRFFWLNAFIAVFTMMVCLWVLVFSLFDRNGRKIHFYLAAPWARMILWVCGIKVRISGQENVDTEVPCIYMTNHQSYFDIFALLACLPVDFKFIVKQELIRIPLFGPSIRKAGYIGIERQDPRKAVESIKKAAEKIQQGASVVIFPEGTRSTDGRLLEFKRGGFSLSLKSGCDIVPVAISNSYRIAPKDSLRINKGSIDMAIGEPIRVKEYSKKNIDKLMNRVKEAMLHQMGMKSDDHPPDHVPEQAGNM